MHNTPIEGAFHIVLFDNKAALFLSSLGGPIFITNVTITKIFSETIEHI